MTRYLLEPKVSARIPTSYGDFYLNLYNGTGDGKEHLALIKGEIKNKENIIVRVHSECFTGDVLGSMRCDCGEQLDRSMNIISNEGKGLVIYLRQEGRGIGLLDKLRAYNLQDQGYDTVDANLALGHQADERDYTIAAGIINGLGLKSIRLMTNNPAKILALKKLGIKVVDRLDIVSSVNPENKIYLQTKIFRMNHMLTLKGVNGANGKI